MKKYNYLYKVTLPETNEFYIGSRTCNCFPKDDVNYKGSMSKWQPDKSKLVKDILEEFGEMTRKDLLEIEGDLIGLVITHPLNRNYHIPPDRFYTLIGHSVSLETRAKISEKLKGRPVSEERKEKLSISSKGNKSRTGQKNSPEQKIKMAEGLKRYWEIVNENGGRYISEETRKKRSEARKGIPNYSCIGVPKSEETKRKISDTLTGRKSSDEAKANISKSSRNSEPEVRAKISASLKGKKRPPFSEETKKKMSEAQKKYHQNKNK